MVVEKSEAENKKVATKMIVYIAYIYWLLTIGQALS